MNAIWHGPHNSHGRRNWFPMDRGTGFAPSVNMDVSVHLNHADRTYDPTLVHVDAASAAADPRPGSTTMEQEFLLGAVGPSGGPVNTYEVCHNGQCTNDTLDAAKAAGTKVLLWHGTQDVFVRWRSSLYWYNQAAKHFSTKGKDVVDYEALYPWMQYFLFPGGSHCGGGRGPLVDQNNMFETLVKWVEEGVEPAKSIVPLASSVDKRPICLFPQTAIYLGGPINDPASYTCGGNLQTKDASCQDLRTPYGFETSNLLEAHPREIDGCGFGAPGQIAWPSNRGGKK
jgi:hypothetical protein